MIVHLRVVPGFGVGVEEARRPELRSGPLVIGGLPQQRGIVREANQSAQQAGVRPGMTLSQAHQHCPHGVFLMPDLPRYEHVWEEICEILRCHTPLVEPVEMGQAACDMSGCERFWSDEWSAGRTIVRQIERSTGIAPSLGMASNRLVAQLASTCAGADGVTVIERGRERAFLADLPLTLLPGVDARLALTFQVLGLTTIGQFAALPSSAVKQRFGSTGEQLHRYARGIDPRPILPPLEKSSIVARYECEDGSIEEAMDGLRTLADTCAGELLRRRAAGRLVGLSLIWTDESTRLLPDRKPTGSLENGEPPALPAPKGQVMARRLENQQQTLPIPYRVHSFGLPQPLEEAGTLIPGPSPAEQEKGAKAGATSGIGRWVTKVGTTLRSGRWVTDLGTALQRGKCCRYPSRRDRSTSVVHSRWLPWFARRSTRLPRCSNEPNGCCCRAGRDLDPPPVRASRHLAYWQSN